MVGINRFKLIIGIFIPFLAIFLMSQNIFAVSYNSWLNIQDISKTNLSNDWVTHNVANRNYYFVQGATTLQTYRLSASANLSTQVSGGYFNASGDIFLDVYTTFEGGIICSLINDAKIAPENVSYTVTSSTLSSCTESVLNPYTRRYTLHIVTSGTITSGSPTSFYFSIGNTSSQPFVDLIGTPNDEPAVFISGDINFGISNSPELAALSELNQNIVVVSENLEEIYSQINDSTDAIIDNQNSNTEAIIKSNQTCRNSKNLFSGNFSQFDNIGGSGSTYRYFKLPDDGTYTLTLISKNAIQGSNTTFLGFTAYGGDVASGNNVRWAFTNGSNATSSGKVFTISNNGLHYVSLYGANSTTLNWFTQNFDIMLEKGSSFTKYEEYGAEICKNINEQYYDEQRQADQNISNQSPTDIDGAENQATTNLIGVLSGFISAFSNINATNCNLTLEFPNYAGGSRVVDICQGKEKAPRIVEIGSSLLLIGVFVPLAYILIKMIYNEIRSWTNG